MPFDRNLLLRVLASSRGRAITVEDVLQRARLASGDKAHVRGALRTMVREGVVEAEGPRYRLVRAAEPPPHQRPARTERSQAPEAEPVEAAPVLAMRPRDPEREVVGTLSLRREGYGFIASLHGGEDLFVPPALAGSALDGDLVRAQVGRGRDGRTAARSLEVLERRRRYAVGTYVQHGRNAWVEPRDEKVGPVQVRPSREVSDGDVVRVALDSLEEGGLRGHVDARLGLPGDPDVEVLSVAYGVGFSDVFPPDAVAAALQTANEVRAEDRQGRRDLTALELVTIDGEDARDFDDAVYVEAAPAGWRLVVAIADVTHYVRPGAALDREALRRATSVYFPGHVLPMLPHQLSNGICSLNPDVERLCVVADMALDPNGRPLDAQMYPAVMRSHARCTYTQVAALLAGERVPELERVAPMLRDAGRLAARMTAVRMHRGAIDFDIPEPRVRLEDGVVRDISRSPRNAAHRLIEEFMLAANEAVARYFEARALPTVFRVHAEPDVEKLEAFAQLAAAYGHEVPLDALGRVGPRELNAFLRLVEGRPEQRALNHLLLRAMMRAVYSAENIGHYGLAAPSYLHFTSPIRRYPDLVVHRLLKQHWDRAGHVLPGPVRAREAEELETVAVHCSERERAATAAEREIDAFYAAVLMRDHQGGRFEGTVASIAEFGVFVETEKPFVEGLVRAETIGPGGRLDARHHRLVFAHRSFSVGDRVVVEVASSDPIQRRIDLRLVRGGREERGDAAGPLEQERAGRKRAADQRLATAKGGAGRERASRERPGREPTGQSRSLRGQRGATRGPHESERGGRRPKSGGGPRKPGGSPRRPRGRW